ncbi:MAG: type secretion system family protein [Burkholderiales bacterium]|jgi:type II secretory pathway component PulF|nr:type secretion system family protein [Burkholderiales bacterium]
MNLQQIYARNHNFLSRLFKKTAMSYKKRMAMYRMLEKMTDEPATLQINEAMEELRGLEVKKDLKNRMWYVYDDIMEQMRSSDADFAKALSRYVPQQDTMIIAASEQDDITVGFTTVIENNKKTTEMRKAFTGALAYPLLMVCVLLILIYYFSVKVIPEFVQNIPDGVVLSSTSEILMTLSNKFNYWFSALIAILVALSLFTVWALPNFINKFRKYLEEIPPFNMYRIMIGCGFLFALNSLGRAGFMQIDALEQMLKLAKPYLRYRIEIIMDKMADGMDIGQALIDSKLNFPDKQMVLELAIQTKYSEDDSLEVLSHTLAEDGLEAIKRQAQVMKYIITVLVFGTIAFLYFAIYQFGMDLSNVK